MKDIIDLMDIVIVYGLGIVTGIIIAGLVLI